MQKSSRGFRLTTVVLAVALMGISAFFSSSASASPAVQNITIQ